MTSRVESVFAYTSPLTAVRTSLDVQGPSAASVRRLKARTHRYRTLAQSLLDPRVISLVETCARELEAEVAMIEAKMSRKAQMRWLLMVVGVAAAFGVRRLIRQRN